MFGPMLASTAVLSLLVSLAVAQPVRRSITKVQQVTEGDFADPALIQVGNIWYSFATGTITVLMFRFLLLQISRAGLS